jgi:hypothetical protein
MDIKMVDALETSRVDLSAPGITGCSVPRGSALVIYTQRFPVYSSATIISTGVDFFHLADFFGLHTSHRFLTMDVLGNEQWRLLTTILCNKSL